MGDGVRATGNGFEALRWLVFAETPDHENAPEARDVPLLFKPFTIDQLKAVRDRVLATV